MSDRDHEGQSGKNGIGEGKQASDPAPAKGPGGASASQLFGHKAGAKPWESVQQNAGSADANRRVPTISAPYPRDAQYAPRPIDQTATSDEQSAPTIFGEVDDEEELTKLHPNYKLLMRIGAVFIGFVILIVGLSIDGAMQAEEVPVPFGVLTGVATLLALFVIIRIPLARYNARGYQISRDRLRVVRGIMWRADTIVPFGRIQHIDVDQGPIERALGIATMTLHTAGSHNASVSLPGLGHELAVQMREEIRGYIKRESM
ncbi:MAG: PH domain-containing protein [Erythrobacter sp.]|uniref:PH domain-containing protein n=1 Tax=Erythrobacter sp. TaxID=1042 RepID=UPI0032970624